MIKATPEITAKMVAMREAGASFEAIGEAFGCHYQTARNYIARAGKHIPKPRTGGGARKAPYRKTRGRTKRECLKCDKPFKSAGIFNRTCPNCQDTNAEFSGGLMDAEQHIPYHNSRGEFSAHHDRILAAMAGPPEPDPGGKK